MCHCAGDKKRTVSFLASKIKCLAVVLRAKRSVAYFEPKAAQVYLQVVSLARRHTFVLLGWGSSQQFTSPCEKKSRNEKRKVIKERKDNVEYKKEKKGNV